MNSEYAVNGFPQLNLPGELWKEVAGSNGRYYASNLGRLLSTNHRGHDAIALMKPAPDANGYLRTVFFINGRYRTVKVHRVIAQVWVNGRPLLPGEQVNHKDFCRANNAAANLDILTQRQNVQYSAQRGRYGKSMGSINGNSKLTEEVVRAIKREYIPHVVLQRMLAAKYGVATITVKSILNGKTWKHVA